MSDLRAFASELRDRYPEDVFAPLTDADHRSVNDALAGRVERTHVTRDRVSADMMRRAAAQAIEYADELDEGRTSLPVRLSRDEIAWLLSAARMVKHETEHPTATGALRTALGGEASS